MEQQRIASPPCELRWFESADALANAAALDWLEAMKERGSNERSFTVALSGGRIAGTFLDAARQAFSGHSELLAQVHFFWADERCVPPTDAESNYRMAAERFLSPLGVPSHFVHRVLGEIDPAEAARHAAQSLVACSQLTPGGHPVIDLVFLGMGEDGHVASLFPGEPASAADSPETFRSVMATKPPPKRITVSYQVLAEARAIWVLISGKGKEEALRKSVTVGAKTPLGRVLNSRPETRVYTDPSCSTASVGYL